MATFAVGDYVMVTQLVDGATTEFDNQAGVVVSVAPSVNEGYHFIQVDLFNIPREDGWTFSDNGDNLVHITKEEAMLWKLKNLSIK